MKYPRYIPAIIQNHFDNFLFDESHGYNALLKKLNHQLSTNIELKKTNNSQELGWKIAFLVRNKEVLEEQISAMNKLIDDPRMKNIYEQLESCLEPQQIPDFIRACWSCIAGFKSEREKRYFAKTSVQKISRLAKSLAQELQELDKLGFSASTELHSIPGLLQKTSNTYDELWDVRKTQLLSYNDWGFCPGTESLLLTLAKQAEKLTFMQSDSLQEAAIKSRQKNNTQEYLRALSYLLNNTFKIPISPDLPEIIATIAEILLEKHEVRVQDLN